MVENMMSKLPLSVTVAPKNFPNRCDLRSTICEQIQLLPGTARWLPMYSHSSIEIDATNTTMHIQLDRNKRIVSTHTQRLPFSIHDVFVAST